MLIKFWSIHIDFRLFYAFSIRFLRHSAVFSILALHCLRYLANMLSWCFLDFSVLYLSLCFSISLYSSLFLSIFHHFPRTSLSFPRFASSFNWSLSLSHLIVPSIDTTADLNGYGRMITLNGTFSIGSSILLRTHSWTSYSYLFKTYCISSTLNRLVYTTNAFQKSSALYAYCIFIGYIPSTSDCPSSQHLCAYFQTQYCSMVCIVVIFHLHSPFNESLYWFVVVVVQFLISQFESRV